MSNETARDYERLRESKGKAPEPMKPKKHVLFAECPKCGYSWTIVTRETPPVAAVCPKCSEKFKTKG